MKLTVVVLLALQVLFGARLESQSLPSVQPQGSHGLRNQQFGLFLRPRDASNKDGEPIVLYPYQPWKCMAWRFESGSDGTRLVNYFTGKSFQALQSSNGKALVQMSSSPEYARAESLHFIALDGGLYEIEVGDKSGVLTAIDSDGKGDLRVIVSQWKGVPAQKWQLVNLPDHFTM